MPCLTIGQSGDKIVYGNEGGHSILARLGTIEDEITALKAKDTKRAAETSQLQKEMLSTRKEMLSTRKDVKRLEQNCEGYLAIRRRFLDVYKRDVKGLETHTGTRAIKEGNVAAHQGDAIGDATLFERDKRTDRRIFCDLYGLDPAQVLEVFGTCNVFVFQEWTAC